MLQGLHFFSLNHSHMVNFLFCYGSLLLMDMQWVFLGKRPNVKTIYFWGQGGPELCNQRPPHPPAPPLQKKFLQSPVLYRCSPPALVYTAAWVPLVPVFRADLSQQASYPWSRPRPELALVLATSWPLLGLFFFWVCPLACLPLHDSSKLEWDTTG